MDQMTTDDFKKMKALLIYGEKLNREDRVDEYYKISPNFNAFIYEKSQMLRLKGIVLELQSYLIYFVILPFVPLNVEIQPWRNIGLSIEE